MRTSFCRFCGAAAHFLMQIVTCKGKLISSNDMHSIVLHYYKVAPNYYSINGLAARFIVQSKVS